MALSRTQKRDILRLYGFPPDKVVVVGAGYNDRLFVQVPKPAPGTVQIVYAGKLSNAKGVPWMLRALSRIDFPDWHLHLVGGGSGREKAECLGLAAGLGRHVTVHGPVSQEHLADIMKGSHLFVLPSLFEGLPLVVLEALASGCRIVATSLPGVGDILEDGRTDFIDLVPTPRLCHVDKPFKADESRFERDLGDALQRQISAARRQPRLDLSTIADRMAEFSWRGVFEKVQALYFAHAA
jgi:glycosyltransferase involved in cell wall biosynthesis